MGIAHTVGVDKLVERTSLDRVDAVGDVGAVASQQVGNVLHFEVAVEERLLVVHQLADALHQLILLLPVIDLFVGNLVFHDYPSLTCACITCII